MSMLRLMVAFCVTLAVSTEGERFQPRWPWSWEQFPSNFFGANGTGFQNSSQLRFDAKHEFIIYGWQSNRNSHTGTGDEEIWLRGQSAMTKWISGDRPVFVYREGMHCVDWMSDEEPYCHSNYTKGWFQNGNQWDWRNESACEFFLNEVVAKLAADPFIDGVFFDDTDSTGCVYHYLSCNISQQDAADKRSRALAAGKLFSRAIKMLNDAGKYAVISTVNQLRKYTQNMQMTPFLHCCQVTEQEYLTALNATTNGFMRFYEFWMYNVSQSAKYPIGPQPPNNTYGPKSKDFCKEQIQNAIAETSAGIPILVHGTCPSEVSFEFHAASFLMAVEEYSYFGCSDTRNTWYDAGWIWHDLYDQPLGRPLSPAQLTGEYIFTRKFEHLEVVVDCEHFNATITQI
eukprot:m.87215 g.87215  ORF g.87215 m.87215 type:complete len:400 (-) comp13095_c0_seq4:1231-2430(-)